MTAEKKRSIYVWTKGIFDLPLIDRRSRYLFWEIDSWSRKDFNYCIETFRRNGLCVYWHTTTNGYHFYNFKVLTQAEHAKIVRLLKPTNHEFTPNTLRIKPNKWEGELELWKNGDIEPADATDKSTQLAELSRFRDWLEGQKLTLIEGNYMVKPYPFEECPKCKRDGKIFCRKTDNKFICKVCHAEAIPRGGR